MFQQRPQFPFWMMAPARVSCWQPRRRRYRPHTGRRQLALRLVQKR